MLGRRKFMQVFGIGALAGKQAAEQEIAKLTSLRSAHSALASAKGSHFPNHGVAIGDAAMQKSQIANLAGYVRMFGLPKHVDQQLREQSHHVNQIDPDIACKRSWSFCVKIQAQRQRNYEYQVEHYRNRDAWSKAQEKFRALTGFDWDW